MKSLLCLFSVLLLTAACSKHPNSSSAFIRYSEFVNPLMGTDSDHSLSNGNTYPAIALPWGMNFWTPRTGEMKKWVVLRLRRL